MKRTLVLLIIIGVVITSCNSTSQKYPKQVETAMHLINLIRASDTQAIKNMIAVELSLVGKDDHTLAFEVSKIGNEIKDEKIENVNSFVFKEYPRRNPELVTIYIPLFDEGATKKHQDNLEVFFMKHTEDGKIHNFRILDADQFHQYSP